MGDITFQTGPVEIDPREAGYNPQKLNKLDELFSRLIKEEKLQCASYLLSRKGKSFAWKSMGRLCYDDEDTLFMPDSIRALASVTKVFTAIGIMQLMENGKLFLDQSVSHYFPEFGKGNNWKIIIEHLLTHTSGLAPDPGFCQEVHPDYRPLPETMEELITKSITGVLPSGPGERWAYCTKGFMLLGEIISRVSGMPYEEYIQKHILDPLGMDDTYFSVPENKRNRVCLVKEGDRDRLDRGIGHITNAGGGLFSTLKDLAALGQAMLNKGVLAGTRILSRKTVEKMTTNQLKDVPTDAWGYHSDDKKYGLGWSIAYRSIITPGTFAHEGAGRVALYIDPVEELIAAWFIPTEVEWVPESLINPMAVIWSGLE